MKQLFWLVSLAWCAVAAEPQVVPIWPGVAPGSEGKSAPEAVRIGPGGEHIISSVHRPTLTVYLPSKETATGAGVVIIPGGGHRELWMDHEGYNVASWWSQHGVAGFILKYRLAREPGSTYTIEGTSLADVKQAIKLVRSRAAEWGVDPQRVGVMGFSAGGELAALAGTRYDAETRPAFVGLIYPAIPHDMPLSKDTPPAFMACGENDRVTPGLPELFLAFKKAGASAELHVYANAGHGFGVRAANPPALAIWISQFHDWLDTKGFLKAPKSAPTQ